MRRKINKMPVQAAAAIMIACILVGILLGNGNALKKATADTQNDLGQVLELSAVRLGKSKNLLTIANRVMADSSTTAALKSAIDTAQKAQNAGDIAALSSANAALLEAVLQANEALLGYPAERANLTAAMDELSSAGSQLNRVVKAYNTRVLEAQKVLSALPMQFLLGGRVPEVYE